MARVLLSRVLTVLGLLTICLGATSSSCSLNDSDSGDDLSFVTELTLRDSDGNTTTTFDRQEQVTMILTVRNRLNTAASIDFTSGRQDDFIVVRESSSSILWQWSEDEPPFSTAASTLDFAAGETKTFTRTWDQLDNNDDQVRAGSYEARGALVYSNFDSSPLRENQQASTLVRFTIN